MSAVNMDDEGDDKDDTKRKTRNLSEKKRRDQFNMLVSELGTMVSTNNRKMDKSTVLKSTISFLRNHNEISLRSRAHDVQEDWKPSFLSNDEFTYLVLEELEGFVMVFSSTGRICYVSESITALLGHNPADVVNKSIFDLTYEEDRPHIYNLLQRNVTATDQIQSVSKDQELVMFELHLRRGVLDFNTKTTYELMTFYGHFRTNTEILHNETDMSYQQDMESGMLFVCTGHLHTPQRIRDVSLVDSSRSEFTSRHSLEWKFLFLDHRAPPIIGYLPFEVLGTSGYDYYHFDDLDKVINCHEALMEKGELTSCYYRFLTKGQQWIWLQTRFYITYHQWSSKPEFVVCTHRVVSYTDLAKSIKKENAEADTVSEADTSRGRLIKTAPSEDASMANMSPSYMSEESDAFGSSYRAHSQAGSSRRSIKDAPSECDAVMAPLSPSYMSEASDAYSTSYRPQSQAETNRREMKDSHYSDSDIAMAPVSPSYMSEASDVYVNSYRTHSPAASVKSASASSTAGTICTVNTDRASWTRAVRQRCAARASENGSVSGESRTSTRHSREKRSQQQGPRYDRRNVVMYPQAHRAADQPLAPQHGIGAQYLDPVPYVSAVSVPAVLPLPLPSLPSLPVIVSQDQVQLQRKHEELQEMIVRQQEELRQVKEQLFLAKLGILQPIINVPYANPEELQMQQQPTGGPLRPPVAYDGARAGLAYPPHAPLAPHAPHAPHPSHPPHPPGPHHHMPQ